jgi:dTDP-4-amino-4,6-dideoxygalactose transaminase
MKTAVPFLDLVTPHRALEQELVAAFRRALREAQFVGGPEVEAFEREYAAFCGTPHCAGVNSGTDALRFAYLALGVRPGDEIITVAHTFIATTEAITQAGGVVRFVDIASDTMTMDPAAIAEAIGPRTVGIVPVHLYGQAADLDPIMRLAARHGLWVVEDAAQAHGGTYAGRPVGSIGTLGCFSFYPGKNLGSLGEGGAVTGSDAALIGAIRRQREHGQSSKYVHETEGYNGRLHAIQAAFLRIKLRCLADWNAQRRQVAAWYGDALRGIPEILLPAEAPYAEPVYHLYVIRTPERDALRSHLGECGIGTGLHYPHPLHLQRAYAHLGMKPGSLPLTERAAATCLSLPMYPELTREQVGCVADAIRRFFGGR